MRSMTVASGTSAPAAIRSTSSAGSLPAALAARSMSPVEICGIFHWAQTRFACVPLPEAGGPTNTTRIASVLSDPNARSASTPARKPLVVARDEVRFDLVDGVESHTDHDHDRRPAPAKGDVELLADDALHDANDGDIERPAERDARQHKVDVVGGLLALTHARDEGLLLLQVVGDVDRLKRDGRVEVAEEDDENDVERVERPVAALQHRLELRHSRNVEVGERRRKHEQRRREDGRDGAARVHA